MQITKHLSLGILLDLGHLTTKTTFNCIPTQVFFSLYLAALATAHLRPLLIPTAPTEYNNQSGMAKDPSIAVEVIDPQGDLVITLQPAVERFAPWDTDTCTFLWRGATGSVYAAAGYVP